MARSLKTLVWEASRPGAASWDCSGPYIIASEALSPPNGEAYSGRSPDAKPRASARIAPLSLTASQGSSNEASLPLASSSELCHRDMPLMYSGFNTRSPRVPQTLHDQFCELRLWAQNDSSFIHTLGEPEAQTNSTSESPSSAGFTRSACTTL